MDSVIQHYLKRGLDPQGLKNELKVLADEYLKHTGRHLFIYASDPRKGKIQGVDVSLNQEDFYFIHDL